MASPYASVTFPDGTTLSSNAYTPEQLQSVLQTLGYGMLGINPPTYSDGRVRQDWQQTGQPAMSVGQDVLSIRTTEEDENYSKIRDLSYEPFDGQSATAVYTYQRTWKCYFTNYGPNSNACARLIIDCMFLPWVHDYLAQNRLYLVPDIPRPVYLKELRDGQYWARTDLWIGLNEAVTETLTQAPIATSVEVIVEYVAEQGATFAEEVNIVPPQS